MDAKESLCAILDSLLELKNHTPRGLLIDYIYGRESEEIVNKHLDELETFGCGDKSDDINYNSIIDKAVAEGYVKAFTKGVGITAKGKKFLKKPTPFIIKDEDELPEDGPNNTDDRLLDNLVNKVLHDKSTDEVSAELSAASLRSRQRIKLIHAIDRKLALDEYAEQEGISFEEILDDLEAMQKNGKKIDIRYFGSEVLGDDCLKELCNYLDSVEDGNLQAVIDEYGDVYEVEELRIARIIWVAERKK